jgi:type II secretory pathway pseudopilin PulG
MNVMQMILLAFGIFGLLMLGVLTLFYSQQRREREQQALQQERQRHLDADLRRRQEQRLAEQRRGMVTSQPAAPSAPTYRTSPTTSRAVSSRPAPVRSAPSRHRGYSRQSDEVDNSPVVAAMLIHQHDSSSHYSDYSDSCGGGGDYGGGGYDGGGGCDCGGGGCD